MENPDKDIKLCVKEITELILTNEPPMSPCNICMVKGGSDACIECKNSPW